MGIKGNRRYTPEFKEQAVQLANDTSVNRAAKQLGVHMANIQRWKTQSEKENSKKLRTSKHDLEMENKRLQAENIELKKVNHILKAAAAFFSRDHLK